MLVQLSSGAVTLVKVPRFNWAGLCMWCEERECTNEWCISMHAASVHAVCPACDGVGWFDGKHGQQRCDVCSYGVAEIAPDAVAPDVLAAYYGAEVADVAPISVPPATMTVALPRCLTCGQRTATAHADCATPTGAWQPCAVCAGLRADAEGVECQVCCGVGFIDTTATATLAERAGEPVFD